LGLVELGLWQD